MAKPKKKKAPPQPDGIQRIAENRRAKHEFAITETYEAGLSLLGTEVKSLRAGQVHFEDAYALIQDGEAYLMNLKIDPWSHGTHANHDATRRRKLLLKLKEIDKLASATRERGFTVIPLKMYFKKGWAKVLLGVAKGKTEVDKRHDIKKRDANRDMQRALRSRG
ncbi:MAG: SsrA-binding protein SmpB [Deltaproteobacteria bacterium]|nr:SsrA-binding protein SmpB [Deltaproteobacteria bacterium]